MYYRTIMHRITAFFFTLANYTLRLKSLEPLIGPVDVLSTEFDGTIHSHACENRARSNQSSRQKDHIL